MLFRSAFTAGNIKKESSRPEHSCLDLQLEFWHRAQAVDVSGFAVAAVVHI